MQHFFIEPSCIQGQTVEVTEPKLLHQISRVLRMESGSPCIFLDNTGFEYEAIIERLDEKTCVAKILQRRMNAAEPEVFLTLYQALPKKQELFEWVLQKGTEIGVKVFAPIITERTERRDIGKNERAARILKEAAEQCARGKIPTLLPAKTFEEMLSRERSPLKILLHGKAEETLKNRTDQSSIALAVGPEGGFTEKEAEKAKKSGWHIASLGPRVLRTETAAIAGTAIILRT